MPDPKPLVLGDAGSPLETSALAWGYINKTGSSLADLATRSAGDLTSGTLADARLSLAMQRGLAPSAFAPTTVFQVGNNDWTNLVYETSGGTLAYSEADGGVVFNGAGCWATVRLRMPVDPNATYTARVVMKKLTGTGVVYVGAKSLNNAFAHLATDSVGSYNYFGALGLSVGVGVTRVLEGSISGYNPTSPTAGVHTKFDPQAKYWDLVLIANYSGTGTTVVQSIEIIKQPLLPLRLSPSTADRAGFNLAHGVAPTSPADGDFWSTTTGLFLRMNGVTRSFLHGGSSLADLATRSAGDLSSGTLPDGRFPATLPAASGANLTGLNAGNLGSGTVPLARLPAFSTVDANSLVLRDGDGRAQVAEPVADPHIATKGYVDGAVEGVDLPPDDLDWEALADLLDLVDPHELAELGPNVEVLSAAQVAQAPTIARVSAVWGSIAANTTATAAFGVPGVVTGATPVNVTPTTALPAGLVLAWAAPTATGVVTVALRNTTGSSISAGTLSFIVQAWLGLS